MIVGKIFIQFLLLTSSNQNKIIHSLKSLILMIKSYKEITLIILTTILASFTILHSQSLKMIDLRPSLNRFELGQNYQSYKYFLDLPDEEYEGKWKKYTGLSKTDKLFLIKIEKVHLLFQDDKLLAFSIVLQNIGTSRDNYDLNYIHDKLNEIYGEETSKSNLKGKDYQSQWKGEKNVCILYYTYNGSLGDGWSPNILVLKRPD